MLLLYSLLAARGPTRRRASPGRTTSRPRGRHGCSTRWCTTTTTATATTATTATTTTTTTTAATTTTSSGSSSKVHIQDRIIDKDTTVQHSAVKDEVRGISTGSYQKTQI